MKNIVKSSTFALWMVLGVAHCWAVQQLTETVINAGNTAPVEQTLIEPSQINAAQLDQVQNDQVQIDQVQNDQVKIQPAFEDLTELNQAQLEQRYETAVANLRASMKDALRTRAMYLHRPSAESAEWQNQFDQAGRDGERAAFELKSAAVEMLARNDTPSPDIIDIATQALGAAYGDAQYEMAYRIAERLAELQPDQSAFQQMRARAAILTNRFDVAKQFADSAAADISRLPDEELKLFRELDTLQKNFAAELELREAEAIADDLPRVELETTQGKIVLELFENQTPETVGNFIFLVEQGFYDGTYFHHVVKNYIPLTIAQTGLFVSMGQKLTRYKIYDELENSRRHFRGVVGMSNVEGVPNSAGSQFFVTAVPVPFLDGHHTVFGRVISDTRVLDQLQPTFTIDDKGKEEPIVSAIPDSIIRARVLRKRDHEYLPHRVEE